MARDTGLLQKIRFRMHRLLNTLPITNKEYSDQLKLIVEITKQIDAAVRAENGTLIATYSNFFVPSLVVGAKEKLVRLHELLTAIESHSDIKKSGMQTLVKQWELEVGGIVDDMEKALSRKLYHSERKHLAEAPKLAKEIFELMGASEGYSDTWAFQHITDMLKVFGTIAYNSGQMNPLPQKGCIVDTPAPPLPRVIKEGDTPPIPPMTCL